MENEKLTLTVRDKIQEASDKLEELIRNLTASNIRLNEKIIWIGEHLTELQMQGEGNRKEILELQKTITRQDERQIRIREDIKELAEEFRCLDELKISNAVQDNRLSGLSKTTGLIIGVVVSIISTIITLGINHLLSGG